MKYLLLALTVILVSCSSTSKKEVVEKNIVNPKNSELKFEVIEIDGCEYLLRRSGYAGYMSHKGNCKNPIHKKD